MTQYPPDCKHTLPILSMGRIRKVCLCVKFWGFKGIFLSDLLLWHFIINPRRNLLVFFSVTSGYFTLITISMGR